MFKHIDLESSGLFQSSHSGFPRGNDESPSLAEHGLQHPLDVPGPGRAL